MVALEAMPTTDLNGVGPGLAQKLEKLGILTVQDLLFHLPLRYEDRTHLTPLAELRAGYSCLIEGEVLDSKVELGRRRSLLVQLQDDTGRIGLRFYYFTAAQKNQLTPGTRLRCFGEARLGRSGLEIYHPEYKRVEEGTPLAVQEALTPLYPTTDGITQPRLRQLCDQALELLARHPLPDYLPPALLDKIQLPPLNDAVRQLHHPPTEAELDQFALGIHPTQQRLAFEELLAHHLSLRRLRETIRLDPALPLPPRETLSRQFLAQLPFALTDAQRRVVAEVSQDLRAPQPMLRLVQGDVGSGKTVVAALAALQAVENGAQVALMAPTEILAEQHYRSFSNWMQTLGVRVDFLASRSKGSQRTQVLERLAQGETQILIGTHAVFQEGVEFARLALAIIDEQHRFGVHQRLALKEKGSASGLVPHQLIMTATPIPRTLAMSAYADLDTSVIDELPPGRTPVETVAIQDNRRQEVIERVRRACLEGRQVYWVCTLIEESEALQCQAAEATAEQLREQLPELRVGLVHGRLKPAEKAEVMTAFKQGEIQLLVATTVIEVGVDVPNASLMIIENPERLGLAQLHQLRGRVGRGSAASFCVLMYKPPLSRLGRERLQVMRETNNGFEIAERDLELRGPGEVLGTRQTGLLSLKVADLERDKAWLDSVRWAAEQIEGDRVRVDALIRRWLGHNVRYGQV